MNKRPQTSSQNPCPTGPWTESYQAAPHHQSEQPEPAPMPKRSFDNDDQRPTHDALSDIYNRGS